MIPVVAHVLLIMAWLCAAQGLVAGIVCARRESTALNRTFQHFFDVMLGCVCASVALLAYSFYRSDFSLFIVFEHVQTDLPWYYRVGALWAGHEGSIMLWLLVLTFWSALYRFIRLPAAFKLVSMTVLISIHAALLSYIIFASSPFERLLPYVPLQGQDLNPLLQDLGMMFHPPILYLGYVGFAVPYAMVVASLITRIQDVNIDDVFEKVVLSAWAFLTLGITLGSFWAYYELGWGGFWFWDPVENASLLPWLVATALVHALQMPKVKRHLLAVYVLTLWAFILSLLGTFLVRSGLLSSVHSFASDPTRGFFILLIVFCFVILGHVFYFKRRESFIADKVSVTSRESFLFINQVLFVIVVAIVFLGTVYPLMIEALGLGFISVGPQYFNTILVPMGVLITLLMGLSISSRFRQAILFKPQAVMLMLSLSVFLWPVSITILAKLGLALFVWVILQTGYDLFKQKITLKRASMHLSHVGFSVFVLGVAISQTGGVEQERKLSAGDQVMMAGSTLTVNHFDNIAGPNFEGVQAQLQLSTPHHQTIIMKPEKRFYTYRNIAISETAIDGNLFRDWYIALGEPLEGDAWSFRIQYKPWMRLIWLGGMMMAAGMLMTVWRRKNVAS